MELWNPRTGERVRAELLGEDEEGRAVFRALPGFEPLFFFEQDEAGNWVEVCREELGDRTIVRRDDGFYVSFEGDASGPFETLPDARRFARGFG